MYLTWCAWRFSSWIHPIVCWTDALFVILAGFQKSDAHRGVRSNQLIKFDWLPKISLQLHGFKVLKCHLLICQIGPFVLSQCSRLRLQLRGSDNVSVSTVGLELDRQIHRFIFLLQFVVQTTFIVQLFWKSHSEPSSFINRSIRSQLWLCQNVPSVYIVHTWEDTHRLCSVWGRSRCLDLQQLGFQTSRGENC